LDGYKGQKGDPASAGQGIKGARGAPGRDGYPGEPVSRKPKPFSKVKQCLNTLLKSEILGIQSYRFLEH